MTGENQADKWYRTTIEGILKINEDFKILEAERLAQEKARALSYLKKIFPDHAELLDERGAPQWVFYSSDCSEVIHKLFMSLDIQVRQHRFIEGNKIIFYWGDFAADSLITLPNYYGIKPRW